MILRLSRFSLALPLVGFTFFGGACSSKDDGPKYPDINSFCNARASAECSQQVLLDCAFPDSATCVARRQQVCVTGKPTNTVYAPAAAESCVNAVGAAYGDGQLTLAENTSVNDACAPVFDGPGAKDATCSVDNDCQESTGLRCVVAGGLTTGTCQIPQMVQGGGSCAAMDAQCVSGFHCGSTAHCDIDAALSESCATIPCSPTLQCSGAGTCVAKTPDGSPCAADAECAHGICNKASTAAMGVCVSQVTLSPTEPFCSSTP
jgi:hypothetical protein